MAEAWTNYLRKDAFAAYSAGITPKGVDPRAVKVMSEAGVNISGQESKDIESLAVKEFDYVVTLCDNAHEVCPYFPGKTKLLHKGFDDPPRLAEKSRDEEEAVGHYRRIRDEIKIFVENLEQELDK